MVLLRGMISARGFDAIVWPYQTELFPTLLSSCTMNASGHYIKRHSSRNIEMAVIKLLAYSPKYR